MSKKMQDKLKLTDNSRFAACIRKSEFYGGRNGNRIDKERIRLVFGEDITIKKNNTTEYDIKDKVKLLEQFYKLYLLYSCTNKEIIGFFLIFQYLGIIDSEDFKRYEIDANADGELNWRKLLEYYSDIPDEFSYNSKQLETSCLKPLQSSGALVSNERGYKANTDLFKNADDIDGIFQGLEFAECTDELSLFVMRLKKVFQIAHPDVSDSLKFEFDHLSFQQAFEEQYIWDVISAIEDKHYIDLIYRTDKTEIRCKVIPVKIVYDVLSQRNYLLAYIEDMEQINIFRFDRIEQIGLCDEKFAKTDEIKNITAEAVTRLEKAWSISLNESSYHVVIDFVNTPEMQYRLNCERRHGKISIINDRIRFEVDVNDWRELVQWVMGYGSNAMVIEPSKFKNYIIERIREGLGIQNEI